MLSRDKDAVGRLSATGGAGRLTIAFGPVSGIPPIRAHEALAGDYVAVTITDTGSDIASDLVDRVFEPFYTTKKVGEGTGLGLSQVFGFAKQGHDVHALPAARLPGRGPRG